MVLHGMHTRRHLTMLHYNIRGATSELLLQALLLPASSHVPAAPVWTQFEALVVTY
jgi:hypothetical protein